MKIFSILLAAIIFFGCQRKLNMEPYTEVNSDPKIITLKHFGKMDTSDDPTTIWQNYTTINNQKVVLELHYPVHSDKKSLFLGNKASLDNLENILQESRKEINRDFKRKGISYAFINDRLKDFEKEDYAFHELAYEGNNRKNAQNLFKKMKIRDIDIFLVHSEDHIILSYKIPKRGSYISRESLVVRYNKDFKLVGITTEE